MTTRRAIEDINKLGFVEFLDIFGNVVERCPFVAGSVWSRGPFTSVSNLEVTFTDILNALPINVKEGLLRCYPDLCARLILEGKLSKESKREQVGVGLLSLTDEENKFLEKNNEAYKSKFGFPFIICVRENRKSAIFNQIEARIQNDKETEVTTALMHACKICHLRIEDIVDM